MPSAYEGQLKHQRVNEHFELQEWWIQGRGIAIHCPRPAAQLNISVMTCSNNDYDVFPDLAFKKCQSFSFIWHLKYLATNQPST